MVMLRIKFEAIIELLISPRDNLIPRKFVHAIMDTQTSLEDRSSKYRSAKIFTFLAG